MILNMLDEKHDDMIKKRLFILEKDPMNSLFLYNKKISLKFSG